MKGPPLPRPKVKPLNSGVPDMNILERLQSITILAERLQDEVLHLKKQLKEAISELDTDTVPIEGNTVMSFKVSSDIPPTFSLDGLLHEK